MRFDWLVALCVVAPGVASARPFPAAWLPKHGNGYLIPDTWAERGLRYGRPELIGLIQRAAQRVAAELPGALLYVGDLSLRSGGHTQWHASHRSGIDADLMFYAVDGDGLPADPPSSMPVFDGSGETRLPDGRLLRFDVERNWALVKALLADGETRVARIFVAQPLRAQLLAYAIGNHEPADLVARASEVLQQPGDSLPHDDHFHVRIAGPPDPPPRIAARGGKQVKGHAAHGRPKLAVRHGHLVKHNGKHVAGKKVVIRRAPALHGRRTKS